MKNLLEENREEFIMDKQARMKELVEVLNKASRAVSYTHLTLPTKLEV